MRPWNKKNPQLIILRKILVHSENKVGREYKNSLWAWQL